MLLQSAAMVAKKNTEQIHVYLLGVIFKVSGRETLSDEKCCFLEKRLQPILKFLLRVTYRFFFCGLLIGPQQTFLESIVRPGSDAELFMSRT